MISKAASPIEYIESLPEDRKMVMAKLRQTILLNLPMGFEEIMNYGMIGYVVPHSIFPAGYHCNPKQPLPFLSIASQKSFIALYHSCIYMDKELMQWFMLEYPKHSDKKPDIGKSCIRFKKPDQIPLDLVAQLCRKITPEEFVVLYQKLIKR